MVDKNRLFDLIGYKSDYLLENLNVEKASLNRERAELNISFSSLMPINTIEYDNLVFALSKAKIPNVDLITYTFSFDRYEEDDLFDYFNYVIKKLGDYSKATYYKKSLDYASKRLTIYVPNDDPTFLIVKNQALALLKKAGFNDVDLIFHLEYDVDKVTKEINDTIDLTVLEAQERARRAKDEEWDQYKPKPLYGIRKTCSEIPDNLQELDEFNKYENKNNYVLSGIVAYLDEEGLKKRKTLKIVLKDDTGYVYCSKVIRDNENMFYFKQIKVNQKMTVQGYLQLMKGGDVNLIITNLSHTKEPILVTNRIDVEPVKRVELHLHTKMTALDGVDYMEDYCKAAALLGHKAIAVTDSGDLQSYHDLFEYTSKNKTLKPIYGVELNYVDEDKIEIAYDPKDLRLDSSTFVVFDLETTGFSVNYERIIEVSAAKYHEGMLVDTFSKLVNPLKKVHESVLELTGINEEELKTAESRDVVLKEFREYIDGAILVAHNAAFDMGHLYKNFDDLGIEYERFPVIDTLMLAKVLYPGRRGYGLDPLCKYLNVPLEHHHRALEDATATGNIFNIMLEELRKRGVKYHSELNSLLDPKEAFKYPISHTIDLIAQNQTGLRNLYHIVSLASTEYFSLDPILTRKVLEQYREGILVGSGTRMGEFFDVAFRKSEEDLEKIIDFYDYIEIEPVSNFVYEKYHMEDYEYCVKDTYKRIIAMAKKHGIPVVAVGDVHQINEDETLFRDILVKTERVGKLRRHALALEKEIPSSYYRTTKEMLDEFSYLGEDLAYEVVVTNTNLIADSCEYVKSFNNNAYPPKDDFLKAYGIPSAEGFVKEMTMDNAHKLYGTLLPGIVRDRIDHELKPIIDNKFSTIYAISHMIVKKSREDGYEVGSRGSVGSSIVAYLMEITEVNSLPPHYCCPKCFFSSFKMNEEEKNKYGIRKDEEAIQPLLDSVMSGYDLPDMKCPVCGTLMNRDGHDIPFETFLGVEENPKTPDIDLNFSSENQGQIHNYIREIFGFTKAFRAGTIQASQDKISFAIVRDYFTLKNEEREASGLKPITHRKAEIEGLSTVITGAKRTCGQHPGGIVVVPVDHEIYDVTPVQYPGDSTDKNWMTTHFDYHTFEKNLFKLDVLGHDDPTCLKYLMEFVKNNPSEFPFSTVKDIPVSDHKLIEFMNNTECIGCSPEDINSAVASFGIPEFGTSFVRELLEEAKPQSFGELLKVSGLSHGTDVWKGNSEDLLLGTNGIKVPFKQIIGCRDDIMLDLINWGVSPLEAFNTMEFVRKGKAPEDPVKWGNIVASLSKYPIPRWYFDTCAKINYLFPKAHAAAYVINALRMAWFKMYRPIYYYSAILSKKLDAYNVEVMLQGTHAIKEEIGRLKTLAPGERKKKDDDIIKTLELCLEMCVRGYTFKNIDLYKSEAKDFAVSDDKQSLYIPFMAIDSLGRACADSIIEARKVKPFRNQQDFMDRTQTSKTIQQRLKDLGVFKGLQEGDQIAFSFEELGI